MSLYAPLSGDNWSSLITVDGHDTTERLSASWNRVTRDYFETIGTPLLRGRALSDRDRPGTPLVTVVNETFARRFFGDGDPIGRHVGFSNGRTAGTRDFEIVGVVGDAKYQDAKGPAYATFFLPFLQTSVASDLGGRVSGLDRSHQPQALELYVMGTIPNLDVELRRALAETDRRMTARGVAPMAEQVAGNFNGERLIATLALAFGAVALLLACLGLYGVTAYSVSRRTREIGIRMAIGATRAGVLKAILAGALKQLAAGLALGLPAALVAGHLLQANLFGVSAHDPATLAVATLALVLCAVVAAIIPARRAASLDPVRALRIE
jgi:predicted permease